MVRLLRNFKAKPCSFNKDEFFRVESVPAANPSSETGAKVTHLRQSRVNQSDEIYGDKVMSKGEHRFVFSISNMASPTGGGLCLGVAEAVDNRYSRRKIGVRVSDGRCVVLPPPAEGKSTPSIQLSERFMSSALQQRAVDRRVEIIVNMDKKCVLFSVDGGTAVDSGVLPHELPESLVPWAQAFFKGGVITLTDHRTRLTADRQPHSPPVLVKPPSRIWEFVGFEAGPWTP